MTTYPLTTLAATISDTGITAPSFADIFASLQASFRLIYGSDAYLETDSQDGQFLAIMAQAIHDCNDTSIDVYNSFSPATARGRALANNVKINGLKQLVPSNSSVTVRIVGQVGTLITNGVVEDTAGNKWNLPATVTIPTGGEISVTATAQVSGAISAAAGTVTKIATPTYGWQTVENLAAATVGAPTESEAALRRRQAVSTSIAAITIIDGIYAALQNITGVQQVSIINNDTATVDANGVPDHTMAVVIDGGDTTLIAQTIALKKTPGTGTSGSISTIVLDTHGVPSTIRFSRPTDVPITVAIAATALTGYVSTTGTIIRQAVVDYINALLIGADVYHSKLFSPANDTAHGATYNITAITLKRGSDPLATSDVVLAFNELASADLTTVSITVT